MFPLERAVDEAVRVFLFPEEAERPRDFFVPQAPVESPPGYRSLPYSVPSARHADFSIKKPRCNWLLQRGLQGRGDWIRTSDLLNPILRVKAASSRRISQMQAFWRLTDSTLHTLYADHSRKSTILPQFPGFSVPKRAHTNTIEISLITYRDEPGDDHRPSR